MHIRSLSAAFLFLVPAAAFASRGAIYGAVYECAADEINTVVVEACSSRFSGLSEQADGALAAWRKRNLAKANVAREACSHMGASENASARDREAFRSLIADKKAEILVNFEAAMREQGAAPCSETIKQLETVGGALEIR